MTPKAWPLGSKANPHRYAPNGWETGGALAYGSFCRCYECGLVERSVMVFDFYADRTGDPLVCEQCKLGVPHKNASPIIREIEKDLEQEN